MRNYLSHYIYNINVNVACFFNVVLNIYHVRSGVRVHRDVIYHSTVFFNTHSANNSFFEVNHIRCCYRIGISSQ